MPAKVSKQKAGKDYPEAGIKKGQEYYSWAHFRGPTQRSLTPPRQSQLTQNEELSRAYSVQEEIEDANATDFNTPDDLLAKRDEWVSELNDIAQELNDKLDNMPDGLREGETGQTLQERAEACEEFANELDAVYLDFAYDEEVEGDEKQTATAEWFEYKLGELQNCTLGI